MTILVIKRVRFLCFSHELDMFLEEATFQFIITAMTPSTKALHNAFNIGLNWGTNYKAGLKQGFYDNCRNSHTLIG